MLLNVRTIIIQEGNTAMENVKYLYSKKNGNIVELYFKIHHNIAKYIRKYTKLTKKELEINLSQDDVFLYRIEPGKNFESIRESVLKTIEKISNDGDAEFFCNHLLTDHGKRKFPSDYHRQMENEYGLNNLDIEWWVAHFYSWLFCMLLIEDEDRQYLRNIVIPSLF